MSTRETRKTWTPLALGLVLVIIPLADVQAAWFHEEVLYDEFGDLGNGAVDTDWQGRVHVVYRDGYYVNYTYSDGAGWSEAEILGAGMEPAVAVDLAGRVHVAWHGTYEGSDEIFYTTFDGLIWSTPAPLSSTTYYARHAAIETTISGEVFIAFIEVSGDTGKLTCLRWDGGSWGEPERLDVSNYAHSPSLASDIAGRVHVVWRDGGVEYGIHYRVWNGLAWGPAERIGQPLGYWETQPTIACDPSAHAHVAWGEYANGRFGLMYARQDGEDWLAPVCLSPPEADVFYPDMGVDSEGEIHLVWVDARSGIQQLTYLRVGGEEEQLTDHDNSNDTPSLAIGDDDQLHAVYRSQGGQEIRYRRNAEIPPPQVDTYGPSSGHRDDQVGVLATGEDFVYPGRLSLRRGGEEDLIAEHVRTHSQEIVGRFDLTGVPIGTWDLVVANPDDSEVVFPGGFEVEPALPWSEPALLPTSSAFEPVLATDAGGQVHQVWSEYAGGNYEIYHARWLGDGWTAGERLTFGSNLCKDAALAADADGNVHLVWSEDRDGNRDLFYKRFDGLSWSADERLTDDPGVSDLPDLAADEDGDLHLVWCDGRHGYPNTEIYYRRWNGSSWDAEQRLTDNAAESSDPKVTADAGGRVHVAWTDERDGNPEVYGRVWDGEVWSAPERLTESEYGSAQPALVCDHAGQAHLLYTEWVQGEGYVLLARVWEGDQWSPAEELDQAAASVAYPDVCADGDGRLHITWTSSNELFYMRFDGVAWTHGQQRTSMGWEVYYPEVAVDGAGRVVLAWQRNLGGSTLYWMFRDSVPMAPPRLDEVSPASAEAFGTHDLTLWGEGFALPLQVRLERWERAEREAIEGTILEASSTHAIARFDFTDIEPGNWSVILQAVDSQTDTLAGGFELLATPWGDEERLTNAAGSSLLSEYGGRAASVDDDGTIHVVWSDNREGNAEIYWKRTVDGVWSDDERLTVNVAASAQPSVAASALGDVIAAWQDTRNGNYEIYAKVRTDGLWGDDVRLSEHPAPSEFPATAADGNGGIHVVWQDGRDGNYEIYHRQWTGGGWTDPHRVTNDAGASRTPTIPGDGGGGVRIAWADDRDGNYEIYATEYANGSWGADIRITDDAGASFAPTLASNGDGVIHLGWLDERDGSVRVYTQRLDIPTDAEPVTEDGLDAAHPSLAVTPDGRRHVVWSDLRLGEAQVWVRTGDDRGWSLPHRVSASPTSAGRPFIAAGGDSLLQVVWQDDRDGNAEIYGRRYGGGVVSAAPRRGPVNASRLRWGPNPFREQVWFRMDASASNGGWLSIFDPSGRCVRRLALIDRPFAWDGRDGRGCPVGTGVYLLRWRTPEGTRQGRVVKVR